MSRSEVKTSINLNERLATSGLRPTVQRQQVYEVLLEKRDHPTAEDVFIRSKHRIPGISIATIYNCLEALVKCGLVKQVKLDKGASRYCPNMHEHFHFHCDQCGTIFDIDAPSEGILSTITVPEGFDIGQCEISLRGTCPRCTSHSE